MEKSAMRRREKENNMNIGSQRVGEKEQNFSTSDPGDALPSLYDTSRMRARTHTRTPHICTNT